MSAVRDALVGLASLDARAGNRSGGDREVGAQHQGLAVGLAFGVQAALFSGFALFQAVHHRVSLLVAESVPLLAVVVGLVLMVLAHRSSTRWSLTTLTALGSVVVGTYAMVAFIGFEGTPFRVSLRCHPGDPALAADFRKSFGPGSRTEAVVYDYGDGTYGSGQLDGVIAADSHRYPRAGTYTVRLTVVDAAGTASDTCKVTVR